MGVPHAEKPKNMTLVKRQSSDLGLCIGPLKSSKKCLLMSANGFSLLSEDLR